MLRLRVCLVVAVAVSALAAATDVRTGRIPDALTLGALALAPLLHAALTWHEAPLAAAAWSVVGALTCGAVPFALAYAGAMGGGDVKLLAALGALLLPAVGLEAEMYAFIAGAALAPARMAYEGKLLRTLANTLALVVNPVLPAARRRPISPELLTWFRFGPAVFAGTTAAALVQWR